MNTKKVFKFMGYMALVTVLTIILSVGFLKSLGVIDFGKSEQAVSDEIDERLLNEAEEKKAEKTQKEQKEQKDKEKTDAAKSKESVVYEEDGKESENTANKKISKGIVVLDPGHGVSTSTLSDEQKKANGWIYNSAKGGWGEWRHFKSGTMWQDCMGSGCSGRAPKNGGCWYPIGAGDRNTEPEINMNNAIAAKKYLEQMGYEVRMTRDSSNHPSMTQRLEYCYPNRDITKQPDADVFVCIHSNAGGGRGSYYIALSGLYDQAGISNNYISSGNTLGKCINDRIVANTDLSAASGGRYDGYPELVLFCKSPITIAYMEIGFFDNSSDLAILKSSSDAIGKAIADGVDDYMNM